MSDNNLIWVRYTIDNGAQMDIVVPVSELTDTMMSLGEQGFRGIEAYTSDEYGALLAANDASSKPRR